MKRKASLILVFLGLVFTSNIVAQDLTRAAEMADKLRLQLLAVQTKEEELRVRLLQLEEDLKPENITLHSITNRGCSGWHSRWLWHRKIGRVPGLLVGQNGKSAREREEGAVYPAR